MVREISRLRCKALARILTQPVRDFTKRARVSVASSLPDKATVSSPLQTLLIRLHRVLYLFNKSKMT